MLSSSIRENADFFPHVFLCLKDEYVPYLVTCQIIFLKSKGVFASLLKIYSTLWCQKVFTFRQRIVTMVKVRRVATLFLLLSSALTFLFLLLTDLEYSPALHTTSKSSINLWIFNRFHSFKESFGLLVFLDFPEKRWQACLSLAEFYSQERYQIQLLLLLQLYKCLTTDTSSCCQWKVQDIDMAPWEKTGKKVKVEKEHLFFPQSNTQIHECLYWYRKKSLGQLLSEVICF